MARRFISGSVCPGCGQADVLYFPSAEAASGDAAKRQVFCVDCGEITRQLASLDSPEEQTGTVRIINLLDDTLKP